MTNLAGVPTDTADNHTKRELQHAGIPIVVAREARHGEVKTRIFGKLRGWTFTRAWYYWVAEGGALSIEAARKLYMDPCGKEGVRVGGHCGCPSPDDFGWRKGENGQQYVDSYHVDSVLGLRLLADAIKAEP